MDELGNKQPGLHDRRVGDQYHQLVAVLGFLVASLEGD
jgi:hypothetical protein